MDSLVASKKIPYQRVTPSVTQGYALPESPDEVTFILIKAIKMREKYMGRVSTLLFRLLGE